MSSLRYSGFDQRDNTRYYVFQYCVPGVKARPVVISAEIPLLVEHHVRIQDGPALCLHTLMLEISGVRLVSNWSAAARANGPRSSRVSRQSAGTRNKRQTGEGDGR